MEAVTKTQGQQTVEDMAKHQQLAMMQNAHIQFVTIVTMPTPPSKMPVEVRKTMWDMLTKTRGLFAPQNDEERTFYGSEG